MTSESVRVLGKDTGYFYVTQNNQLYVYKRGESLQQSTLFIDFRFNETASILNACYFRLSGE